MRTITLITLLGLAAIGATLPILAGKEAKPARSSADTAATPTVSRLERGKYLVTVGGCNDCHTPLRMGPKGPEPDMSRMLSGHPESFAISEGVKPGSERWIMTAAATGTAFSGPWGVSFAANLTPDQNTGLGIWTEELFMK